MSYSRWSSSCWYTYWSVGPENDGEGALVIHYSLHDEWRLTYEDIKDGNVDEILDGIANKINTCDKYSTGVKKGEMKELRDIMEVFLEDVEEERKEKEDGKQGQASDD